MTIPGFVYAGNVCRWQGGDGKIDLTGSADIDEDATVRVVIKNIPARAVSLIKASRWERRLSDDVIDIVNESSSETPLIVMYRNNDLYLVPRRGTIISLR